MADADGVIVVSQYMRSLLLAAEPRLDRDLHVLSRPIRDLGVLRPRRRATPIEPAVVTYAGRINTEKGLAVVIEALAATDRAAPVQLRIAGVVEDEEYWATCRAAPRRGDDGQRRSHRHLPGSPRLRRHDELFASRTSSPCPRVGRSRSAPSPSKRWPPAPRSSPRPSAVSPTSSSTATTGSTPTPATPVRGPTRSRPPRAARHGRRLGRQARLDVTLRHRGPRPRPRQPRRRLPHRPSSPDVCPGHRQLNRSIPTDLAAGRPTAGPIGGAPPGFDRAGRLPAVADRPDVPHEMLRRLRATFDTFPEIAEERAWVVCAGWSGRPPSPTPSVARTSASV